MDNKELMAESKRLSDYLGDTDGGPVMRGLSAALEAAEAELTGRDTVIEQIRSGVARRLDQDWDDTQSTDTDVWKALEWIDGLIADHREESAAAPVSLEAVNTTLAQVIADALGWDWESAHGVPSPVEAVSDVAAAVEQHLSLEAVKAATTTEWGLRYKNLDDEPVYISHGDEDPRASSEAAMVEGDVLVSRQVTEWRPVETEGDNRV